MFGREYPILIHFKIIGFKRLIAEVRVTTQLFLRTTFTLQRLYAQLRGTTLQG